MEEIYDMVLIDDFFKERGDLEAGEKELLKLFDGADAPVKKRLLKFFIRYFKAAYGQGKNKLKNSPPKEIDMAAIIEFANASQVLRQLLKRNPIEEQAETLGETLGFFLAAVEYGILNEYFSMSERTMSKILGYTEDTATHLRGLNKRVSYKFIKNRVLSISKKHSSKISPEKRKFLMEIASQFH